MFVLITLAAVGALLLMSMPRLRWWQRPRAARPDTGQAAPGKDAAEALAAAADQRELAGLAAGAPASPVVSAPVAADSPTGPLPGLPADRAGLAGDPFGGELLRADPLQVDVPLRADPLHADPPDYDQFGALPLAGDGLAGDRLADDGLADDGLADGWPAGRPLAEPGWQATSWQVRPSATQARRSDAARQSEAAPPLSFWRQPEGDAGDGGPQAGEGLTGEAGEPGRSIIGTVPPAVSGSGIRPGTRRQPRGGFAPQLRGTAPRSAGSPQNPARESAAWGSAAPHGAARESAAWENATADWWRESDGTRGDGSGEVSG